MYTLKFNMIFFRLFLIVVDIFNTRKGLIIKISTFCMNQNRKDKDYEKNANTSVDIKKCSEINFLFEKYISNAGTEHCMNSSINLCWLQTD